MYRDPARGQRPPRDSRSDAFQLNKSIRQSHYTPRKNAAELRRAIVGGLLIGRAMSARRRALATPEFPRSFQRIRSEPIDRSRTSYRGSYSPPGFAIRPASSILLTPSSFP